MSSAHEVAEHRRRVCVDAVVVAEDEVVGDESYEALCKRTGRAARGGIEVGLREVLATK